MLKMAELIEIGVKRVLHIAWEVYTTGLHSSWEVRSILYAGIMVL